MHTVSVAIDNLALINVLLDVTFQPQVYFVLAQIAELGERTKLPFVYTPTTPTGNDIDPARVKGGLADYRRLSVT